ncbi:D-alanyl-D-alanine carboxypeptidase family protein, partial [Clostridium perfringens]|nr:D-alanyl-D-alanine carboxypeptidase family protein [Clostridium perfringens]
IVNKEFGLPDSSAPGESTEARKAFESMKADAGREGIYLNAFSTYRSYWSQDRLYWSYVSTYGQDPTDTFSAKPGFSEHQTGLAFDIGGLDQSLWAKDDFKYTKEAEWLKNNSYKYGFILRYPEGKEWKTGYMHESWHFRYIGVE